MNIQPGMLCLITKGPACGETITVIEEVSEQTISQWFLTNVGYEVEFLNPHKFWKVDRNVLWQDRVTKELLSVPYEVEDILLPIPPLADDTHIHAMRELEHS